MGKQRPMFCGYRCISDICIMAKLKLRKAEFWKIGVLLGIFIVGVIVAYQIQKPKETLPIINPAMLNEALVEDSLENVGVNHKISDFNLVDHHGVERTLADVEGKILVVDFFFTTCPSICIDMTKNLRKVQEAYKDEPRIQILSHSVQPEYDTVEVLQAYAEANGVNYDQWWLLTGDPYEINRLARTSYFAVMEQGEGWDEHSFIHTENIILVDEKGRLRGFYDGTSDADMQLMIDQIPLLLDADD